MPVIGAVTDASGLDPHAVVELEWREDINLIIDVARLIRPTKDRAELHRVLLRFIVACMLNTATRLEGVEPTRAHLSYYHRWMILTADLIKFGTYPGLVPGDDDDAIPSRIYISLLHTDAAATATAIHRIWKNCLSIFIAEMKEPELLWEDEVFNSCTTSCRTETIVVA
ncbi:hypothetical protein BDW72DRAFT_198812 [Aspergillus terricola var. indicus]